MQQSASHPNAYKKIAYTYPPLLLRVLVRIPRVLGLRLELLVQTPLESPLAAAIEALLTPLLGVHAAGVGRQPIEAIRSVSAQYLLAIGARRRGPVTWVQSRMPGCLSMRLSPDFGWVGNPFHISRQFAWHKCPAKPRRNRQRNRRLL